MKTIEELQNFYETTLKTALAALENERIAVAEKVMWIGIICGICLAGALLMLIFIGYFAILPAILAGIAWFLLYRKSTKGYKSNFKEIVIKPIIQFLDPNLAYSPNERIPEPVYRSSKIFPQHVDRYSGDDLVYGKIGQTRVTFSELHTEYRTESRDSKGHTTTHWHTIFKGLFFVADFNKNFKGSTLVLPDIAERTFGKLLGNLFQSWNKLRGELIKLEDPAFEKLFAVYGTDQIEARYILSTSLMKRITDYKLNRKKDIYLSFINNNIFVAISYYKNLFEPKIFKTLLDFEMIREYFDDLQLAVSLVEELNLNTRIWGA